jgi:Flp pilus assembly protein CpaB
MEYVDPKRRGRFVIILGVVLALLAGGVAFYAMNQAQRSAGQGSIQRVTVVVAARDIAARKPIEPDDVQLRQVPLDETNEQGIFSNPELVVGRVLAVALLRGQLVTSNLMASPTGSEFSVRDPSRTFDPEMEPWRAVSITVQDDRAVGGIIEPNQAVDIIVTALVNVPQDLLAGGRYYTDKSTKVVYQDMITLARRGQTYIIRAPFAIAEEISHLQASGTAVFSLVLRADSDTEIVDATNLGVTTNRIIKKYGLPIPEIYPFGSPLPPVNQALAAPAPKGTSAPSPTLVPAGSPGA